MDADAVGEIRVGRYGTILERKGKLDKMTRFDEIEKERSTERITVFSQRSKQDPFHLRRAGGLGVKLDFTINIEGNVRV